MKKQILLYTLWKYCKQNSNNDNIKWYVELFFLYSGCFWSYFFPRQWSYLFALHFTLCLFSVFLVFSWSHPCFCSLLCYGSFLFLALPSSYPCPTSFPCPSSFFASYFPFPCPRSWPFLSCSCFSSCFALVLALVLFLALVLVLLYSSSFSSSFPCPSSSLTLVILLVFFLPLS